MTTPHLPHDIEREEGREACAYADPLTGGAPWTIGVGHTGREVTPDLEWTSEQIDAALAADIARCTTALDARAPWWRDLDDVRQDVIVQMAFQMGVSGVLAFRRAAAALQARDWERASALILDSAWAQRQTPRRAHRLAEQLRTGERPA